MALIEKLSAIAEAIRDKTGKEENLTLDQMVDEIGAIDTQAQTYILVDEDGNEIPAVLVDEPVEITATANDIRLGATAVTGDGIIVGTKEIPSYHTTEGFVGIQAGKAFSIRIPRNDRYDYTKLQAIICLYNTTAANSVSADKVCINDKVYEVRTTVELSTVTVDHDSQTINLGITNDSKSSCVLRYFTYKEEV